MPTLDLPADGEKPWGQKLRDAIDEVSAATDAKIDGAGIVVTVEAITRTAYDALDPKDATTLYLIDETL